MYFSILYKCAKFYKDCYNNIVTVIFTKYIGIIEVKYTILHVSNKMCFICFTKWIWMHFEYNTQSHVTEQKNQRRNYCNLLWVYLEMPEIKMPNFLLKFAFCCFLVFSEQPEFCAGTKIVSIHLFYMCTKLQTCRL